MLFSVSTRLMEKGTRASVTVRSYAETGEYWIQHDLSDVCGKTRKVKFDVVLDRRQPTIQSQRIYRTSFKRSRTNSEFPLTLSTFYERHLRHCRTIESATAPAQFTEDPRPSRDCSPTASCRSNCPPAHTSRPRANLFFSVINFLT